MNIVKELLNNDSSKIAFICHDSDNKNPSTDTRYYYESNVLGKLAKHQLNLDKNKIKDCFEDLGRREIFTLLQDEIRELYDELFANNINYEKAFLELGDCAAVITGILAWLMNNKRKQND